MNIKIGLKTTAAVLSIVALSTAAYAQFGGIFNTVLTVAKHARKSDPPATETPQPSDSETDATATAPAQSAQSEALPDSGEGDDDPMMTDAVELSTAAEGKNLGTCEKSFCEATISGAYGIGTDHAMIVLKHTRKDAVHNCAEEAIYDNRDRPAKNCVALSMAEKIPELEANCLTGNFGGAKIKEIFNPRFGKLDENGMKEPKFFITVDGERVDIGGATTTFISQYHALCPMQTSQYDKY